MIKSGTSLAVLCLFFCLQPIVISLCGPNDCKDHIEAKKSATIAKLETCKAHLEECTNSDCGDEKATRKDSNHENSWSCTEADSASECHQKFIQFVNNFDFNSNQKVKFSSMLEILSDMKESNAPEIGSIGKNCDGKDQKCHGDAKNAARTIPKYRVILD